MVSLGIGKAVGRETKKTAGGSGLSGYGSGVAGRDGEGRWPEGLEGLGADLEWGWRQVRTARRKQKSSLQKASE